MTNEPSSPTTPRVDSDLLNRLEAIQKAFFDAGLYASAMDIQSARATLTRPNPPSTGGASQERIALISDHLGAFHRNACYPSAEPTELYQAAAKLDAALAVPKSPALDRDTVERCAQVAKAHKGSAKKKRGLLGERYNSAGAMDEIYAEERGEDIAAEIIEREIRALTGQPARSRNDEAVAWAQRPAVFPESETIQHTYVSREKTMTYRFPLYAAPSTNAQEPARNVAAAGEDSYKSVIDEALVTRYLGVAEGNPRKELNTLLSWEVAVALDPRVSSAAQALIDQGSKASPPDPAVRWLPIETFDPINSDEPVPSVLVVDRGMVSEAYYNGETDTWWLANTSDYDFDHSEPIYPTLWMPLPSPPDAGAQP